MYKHLALIFWPALAGLFGALLILDRWVLPEEEDRWSERNERVSYARAVRNATPAVVNIYTAKLVTDTSTNGGDDSFFRRLNPPRAQQPRLERSLGSGVIMATLQGVVTIAPRPICLMFCAPSPRILITGDRADGRIAWVFESR